MLSRRWWRGGGGEGLRELLVIYIQLFTAARALKPTSFEPIFPSVCASQKTYRLSKFKHLHTHNPGCPSLRLGSIAFKGIFKSPLLLLANGDIQLSSHLVDSIAVLFGLDLGEERGELATWRIGGRISVEGNSNSNPELILPSERARTKTYLFFKSSFYLVNARGLKPTSTLPPAREQGATTVQCETLTQNKTNQWHKRDNCIRSSSAFLNPFFILRSSQLHHLHHCCCPCSFALPSTAVLAHVPKLGYLLQTLLPFQLQPQLQTCF